MNLAVNSHWGRKKTHEESIGEEQKSMRTLHNLL